MQPHLQCVGMDPSSPRAHAPPIARPTDAGGSAMEAPVGVVVWLLGTAEDSLDTFARSLQRDLVRRGYVCARLVKTDDSIGTVGAALALQGFVVLIEARSLTPPNDPNQCVIVLSGDPQQCRLEALQTIARRCA